MNFFGGKGCLTDEQRKKPLQHDCEHFTFRTCVDLSEPIRVSPFGSRTQFSLDEYSNDLSAFMVWWSMNVLPDLIGFNGFHNRQFVAQGFAVIH
jgi:hypothetical protein